MGATGQAWLLQIAHEGASTETGGWTVILAGRWVSPLLWYGASEQGKDDEGKGALSNECGLFWASAMRK